MYFDTGLAVQDTQMTRMRNYLNRDIRDIRVEHLNFEVFPDTGLAAQDTQMTRIKGLSSWENFAVKFSQRLSAGISSLKFQREGMIVKSVPKE